MMARYQNGVGESYLYSGRYDEAITELIKKGRALEPNTAAWFLGVVYWQTGMYEEALRMWEVSGLSEAGLLRYYALTGQREKALGVLEHSKSQWAQGDAELFFQSNMALVYADLGEKDQALDWLERAYQARSAPLIYVKVDPGFYSQHEEPRFQALVEKMK